MQRRHRGEKGGSRLLVTVLALSTICTTYFGFRAFEASRSHHLTAEAVVHDYERIAASETVRRIDGDIDADRFYPGLNGLAYAIQMTGQPLPYGPALDRSLGPRQRAALSISRGQFRIDIPSGRISVSPGSPGGLAGALEGLLPTLMYRNDPQTDHGILPQRFDGRVWLLVFTPLRTSKGLEAVIGFVTNVDALRPAALHSFGRDRVLPAVLAGGVLTNDKLSVRMITEDGTLVFNNGVPFDPTFGITETFHTPAGSELGPGEIFNGGSIRVSIPARYAPQLIIGGVPRSDLLPSVLGISCSVLLLLVGIHQLRREETLIRLRTDFVASVSHELRTPLTQIRMFAETLLLDRVRSLDERRRSLEIIDRESRRLTHLVENVLCFSRGERGGIRVKPEEVDLGAVATSSIEAFQPLARARGVSILINAVPQVIALSDPDAMRQVVLNLLDNAVKYGPDGQNVIVSVTPFPPRIMVEDEGPGIPSADQKRIWNRFVRLERDQSRHHGGSGIGLSVVRDLVEIQGGRVWVELRDSGGSRFVVELHEPADGAQVMGSELATGLP